MPGSQRVAPGSAGELGLPVVRKARPMPFAHVCSDRACCPILPFTGWGVAPTDLRAPVPAGAPVGRRGGFYPHRGCPASAQEHKVAHLWPARPKMPTWQVVDGHGSLLSRCSSRCRKYLKVFHHIAFIGGAPLPLPNSRGFEVLGRGCLEGRCYRTLGAITSDVYPGKIGQLSVSGAGEPSRFLCPDGRLGYGRG